MLNITGIKYNDIQFDQDGRAVIVQPGASEQIKEALGMLKETKEEGLPKVKVKIEVELG